MTSSGVPAGAVSPGYDRPLGDHAVDGAANLRVRKLCRCVLVLALRRRELPFGRFI